MVERILREYGTGAGQTAIASALNRDRVPTAHGGARWYQGTVRAVLRSAALAASQAERTIEPVAPAREAAGARATPGGKGSLPLAFDTFVGREHELAELATLLNESRLITLVGSAGVGKTRLAVELARRTAGRYADGAWMAELAGITDAALVPHMVARLLSIWELADHPITDTLLSHCRDRHLLLILDNCEHLLAACADLASAMVGGCARVTILATSQVPLAEPTGRIWTVPALTLPSPADATESLAASEAVRLFRDRATEVPRGNFALTTETAPTVGNICRRLDGVPLAIELAAARVGVITVDEIAERLDNRFALLGGGHRGELERHQTLRGALDWSYDLLSDSEQAVLRKLSVFVGSCTLEAVEEVCRGEAEASSVLDSLAVLVARSLVVADTTASPARYRLLESVRAHAAERLARGGETAGLRDRHTRWVVNWVERVETELTGPYQDAWFDRLDADHGNVLAALRWAVESGDERAALRLAGALTLFWRVRGRLREGVAWLTAASNLGATLPAALRAKVMWGKGFLIWMLGDSTESRGVLEQSLALAEGAGSPGLRARAMLLLGNISVFEEPAAALIGLEETARLARTVGDDWCLAHALALSGRARALLGETVAARSALEESIAVARRAGDPQGLGAAVSVLGYLRLSQGDYEAAETLLREGLVLARRLGEPIALALALVWLGEVALATGDTPRARELIEEALKIRRVTGHAMPNALCDLGRVAYSEGDLATARAHFEEAERAVAPAHGWIIDQGLGDVLAVEGDLHAARLRYETAAADARSSKDAGALAAALFGLGDVARAQSDPLRAARLHHEALELRHGLGRTPGVAESLDALGAVAAQLRRFEHAARLIGAAKALRQATGQSRIRNRWLDPERDVASIKRALGARQFADMLAEGAALTADQAVAYAQRGRGSRSRPTSGWAALTRAEQDVADLASRGLGNRAIGERLFISPRTVGGHMSRVLAKLGIGSRMELTRVPRTET